MRASALALGFGWTGPRLWILAACALGCAAFSPATADTPGNAQGLFVVADALTQFDALKHHAEALAWRKPEAPVSTIFNHYQGLARNPHTGVPVFYVSQLQGYFYPVESAGGFLHVVKFDSRPTTGERLRSNLQQRGNDTEEAYLPSGDTWVRSIWFNGTPIFDGVALPVYKHPGSMALVDDVLFVPVDQPTSDGAPTGQLLLFDVSADPLDPVPLQALPLPHAIDNVAVTRLPDGTWSVWTNGDGGNDIHVYHTTTSDLRADSLGLTPIQAWHSATGLSGADWPTGPGGHQASAFLRDANGTLHLIGMRHDGVTPFTGSDYADLYRVDEAPSGQLSLTHLRTREFHCVYDGGDNLLDMRVCNMAASNNAYVTPTGELILYSIPHDEQDGFDPDIVRMGEFRHRDVNREGSPLRVPGADASGPYVVNEGGAVALAGAGTPPADRPWVELYDEYHFGDRSIVVDYDDRSLLELNEFDQLDGFTDKTSSVRWRSPVGLDIALFDDDDFSDRWILLRGTGRTEKIPDLDPQAVVTGLVEHFDPFKGDGEALKFGDKTSSLRWQGTTPDGALTLKWDLDGDGVFGETGAAATRGDETGASPTFDASGLDGPIDVPVSLRFSAGGAAEVGEDDAVVHVLNVPPTVTIDTLDGGLPGLALVGLPVHLTGHFTDVPADAHTAKVDWDDAVVSPATVDAATSTVAATHVYTAPGAYDVRLVVTDDDHGSGSDTAPLTVHDPIGAVADVLAEIDALLGSTLDPEDRAALLHAREMLDGRNAGEARDGALDKLAAHDPVAALVMIEEALDALDGVTGPDVSSLERLLALAANSIARVAREALAGAALNRGQENRLAQADAWLADGESKLAAGAYADAVNSFRFATAPAQGVSRAAAGAAGDVSGATPTRLDLRVSGASPATDRVRLRLAVPARATLSVGVFDVRGAQVRSLTTASFGPGWHTLDWDGRDAHGRAAPAGVYLVNLKSGRDQVTARVILLR